MPNLKDLRNRLLESPSARATFLTGTLSLLKDNGVDVDDPDVLKSLDLEFDLRDGQRFVDGLKASTVVITIVM